MKVRELLDVESKWTAHAFARDSKHRSIHEDRSEAVCWCLTGAINKCYSPEECQDIKAKVRAALDVDIIWWNDAPNRIFEDIRKLIMELDI